MLLVVNYHSVSENSYPFPGIRPTPPQALREQLLLLRSEFSFVSLAEIAETAGSRSELPERACLLTFDDGLRDQYENALPLLDEMNIPAAFFVNTAPLVERHALCVHEFQWLRANVELELLEDELRQAAHRIGLSLPPVLPEADGHSSGIYDTPRIRAFKYWLHFVLSSEKAEDLIHACFDLFHHSPRTYAESLYMDTGQWLELSRRGFLGAHGHKHSPLAALGHAQAKEDLETSVHIIEEAVGIRPIALAYPFGNSQAVNKITAEIASAAGFELGFTMGRRINDALDSPLMIARFDVRDVFDEEGLSSAVFGSS